MPEDVGGFKGRGGLNLIKDAWAATLLNKTLNQLTEFRIPCHPEAIGEVIAAPWEAIWELDVGVPGRLVGEIRTEGSDGVLRGLTWGAALCCFSNVIHCRGCLVCVCCFASPVAHTSGFSFEGEASGVGYWETNGLVIVETSNASLSCAVASGAPSAYGSVREWILWRAVSALLSNSFVEGLRTEMNGNGFMD